MILSAFLLLMQAAPEQQPVAAEATTEQPVVAEEVIAPEPKMKRVCKKVLDTSAGPIAKSRKVCREVPDEAGTATASL